AGGRLPTEAEWEYAARVGEKERSAFSGHLKMEKAGWFKDNSQTRLNRTGRKHKNRAGLFDIIGRVTLGSCSGGAFDQPFQLIKSQQIGMGAKAQFRHRASPLEATCGLRGPGPGTPLAQIWVAARRPASPRSPP
ncbi:hypothetical protein EOM89_02105, partial [Candidatus Falkowbacteria bacterium]|nr:hypothetical protein [Candidatus Falkowbacteria bacterium]